jgi:hypothetical protein
MRGAAIWAIVLPLSAAGVLTGHALAYAAVGVEAGDDVHGYLAHAPQLVAVFATVSLCLLAIQGRSRAPAPWQFAALALAVFVFQEHTERLLHSGDAPWLFTRPAFLLGLLFQILVAVIVWWLARRLLALDLAPPTPPARLSRLLLEVVGLHSGWQVVATPVRRSGRGPPSPP